LIAEGDSKPTVSDDIEWEDYKKQFGKSYKTKASENAHKQAFLDSQGFVKEHNGKHSRGEKKYSIGINHLADLLPAERDIMLGHRPLSTSKTESDNPIVVEKRSTNSFLTCSKFVPNPSTVLPASVDWRTKGYVTPVKNQGQCGSCWSFSATGALEGQMFKKTGKLPSLSEQNLVDCDTNDGGCNGGNSVVAFAYVHNNGGIDTEASYPYSANTLNNGVSGTCAYNKANVAADDVNCVTIQSGNETALKYAVATVGPISVAIYANFSEFYGLSASSGTVDDEICDSPPPTLDHAVLIVGYGTDSSGTDYWIVKNSWSTSWGNGGYFNLVRGKDCIGIADDTVYPTV